MGNIFTESGQWYKGNLHAHTIHSDGKLTPEQSVQAYKQHGYSFMCLSEHDHFTDWRQQLDSEDFILLPGLEASTCLVDTSQMDIDAQELLAGRDYLEMNTDELWWDFCKKGKFRILKTHHIHGILGNVAMQAAAGDKCLREDELTPIRVYLDKWNGQKAAQDLTDYLQSRGCFTTYNHPIWSRVDTEDVRDLQGAWAMEVYNYATVNECGEGEDTTFWDAMLRRGTKINAFAADDNHNGGVYPESFGGFVMVQAEALTHENIVNALMEGRYYSSSGAVITQYGMTENTVHVTCARGKRVNFIFGGGVGSSRTIVAANDIPLTHVECKIPERVTYVRVEVIDEKEKRAWTNPIMLNK